MRKLEVVYRRPEELHPRPDNPRLHSKEQIQKIAQSQRTFGYTNPILTDENDRITAGHGRVEAAKLNGLTEIPTICLSGLSEAQVRAYVVADNRLAEAGSSWDRIRLGETFDFLAELDLDFDLAVTGFDLPDIDALIGEAAEPPNDPDDKALEPAADPAITRLGDVWQVGDHKLICADSTHPETYSALLDGEQVGMIFSDPPYNVEIDGHVSGLGRVQHREFAMASGEMTPVEYAGFLCRAFCAVAKVSKRGAIHFHCMDWRHIREMLEAGHVAYHELKNVCVWTKTNGGMGSLYRSAHELVFVWKVGTEPHVNNVELGKHGRYRTNVWSYPGANSFGATREQDLAMHPTVKPVAMVMDAILDCSTRKDIVLDPFAGSGTTLLAAHRTGRRGYGVELDPAYCDLIVRRLQTKCKAKAVLAGDGRTFDEVAAQRGQGDREESAA